MSELITIVSSSPLLSTYCTDNYGGKTIQLSLSPTVTDAINWINSYRLQIAEEERARKDNPVLQELNDSYKTALQLMQQS